PLRWGNPPITHRDAAYGPHAAQRGDVYLPTKGGNRGDIVVVHGVAFVEGDRRDIANLFGPVLRQTHGDGRQQRRHDGEHGPSEPDGGGARGDAGRCAHRGLGPARTVRRAAPGPTQRRWGLDHAGLRLAPDRVLRVLRWRAHLRGAQRP